MGNNPIIIGLAGTVFFFLQYVADTLAFAWALLF